MVSDGISNLSAVGVQPNSINEDEELVIPEPNLVHRSAGAIPRRDAEIIRSFSQDAGLDFNSKSNGTVMMAGGSGSCPVSGSGPSSPAVAMNSTNWSTLFDSKLNAKGMSLSFVAPCLQKGS